MSNSEQLRQVVAEHNALLGNTAPYTEELPDIRLFQNLDDRFSIQALHRTTGGSVVYKGIDLEDGSDAAIKVFAEPTLRRRVQVTREIGIHLLATLNNTEGFLPVKGSGTVEENGETYRYLATEFCHNGTLPERKVRTTEELKKVMLIAGDTATALAELHGHNLVHRDVKPNNILISPKGHGWLGDLGLVTSPVIKKNAIYGSVGYVSMEAMEDGIAGPEADSFALGATVHQATTGRLPWAPRISNGNVRSVSQLEKMMDVLDGMKNQKLYDPSVHDELLPRELGELLLGLLSHDPKSRPDMKEASERFYAMAA